MCTFPVRRRAGTDCVGHLLRVATDADPEATVLSVDGIGAYNHVHRAAMLSRLLEMPRARSLLPFVRLSYGQPSQYTWQDEYAILWGSAVGGGRSVLSATGEPHPHTAEVDGVVLLRARQDKERTYPELIGTGRCMLVVVVIETGGRWSDESVGFIRQLAFAKAREVPKYLRWPTFLAWGTKMYPDALNVVQPLLHFFPGGTGVTVQHVVQDRR